MIHSHFKGMAFMIFFVIKTKGSGLQRLQEGFLFSTKNYLI